MNPAQLRELADTLDDAMELQSEIEEFRLVKRHTLSYLKDGGVITFFDNSRFTDKPIEEASLSTLVYMLIDKKVESILEHKRRAYL